MITQDDLFLFNEGSHRRLAEKLGAHLCDGGVRFAVWAPDARGVSVVGDWNWWQRDADALSPCAESGIWEGLAHQARKGQVYKFAITTARGEIVEKADPFAFFAEVPPKTGSVVWDLGYEWGDDRWMATRLGRQTVRSPISIYEVHLGSWRRTPDRPHELLSYTALAPRLVDHVQRNGFTHVELLPVMEHPFYGSWGYQTTGYFAPSARYGEPQEFMALVDALHQAGIGVILDWVPSHFPSDAFALATFDGTHLYEHADPRRGVHPDWNSLVFNYGRHEVRSFLASSADHWLRTYHADGLRVDAVASMLYLDYSRRAGEWEPNVHGGREDLDAIAFLRQLNTGIYADHPDVQTFAEESTAWGGVSRPVEWAGLGFGFKWDMGWMHDTLRYMDEDPVHRRWHHGELTFRAIYAFTENFVLPLSHDEVVHGKGSLLAKMPGDDWQRRANLRLLYGYQYAVPGKKLLFMGSELADWREWNHDEGLHWELLDDERHAGVSRWVRDLNELYRSERALHELDTDPSGFEWVQYDEADISVLSFLRKSSDGRVVLVVCNFTPVPRDNLLTGVPVDGFWREVLNSDALEYGGSGIGNMGGVDAQPVPSHGRPRTLTLVAPPLGCVFLSPEPGAGRDGASGERSQHRGMGLDGGEGPS
ncbi:MAG TPA: 1,4-alpha-glucan branching protein GlgB [Acidimicrobiales bacterium]|nr:1,4-alpha-glucan branching protein GlgB [Acidimicrobiales bacterium]